jgi:RNA polymerase sigma-70 factor (ECF subfamily)
MAIDAAQQTTQILLHRIRDGDDAARVALVRRIEPLLLRFARGRVPLRLRHEQDTADLLQTTWLKVLDKLGDIRVEAPGDFFSYLRTVLLNALREALRRQDRSPNRSADGELPDLAAENVAPEDWLAYEQVLDSLPHAQRVLMLMRFEFGMSFVEIGAELDEQPDTIRMRVNRAIEQIAGTHHE